MAQRMKNPALVAPEAMKAIQALIASARNGGVSESTLELVHLRASQINGCSACVAAGARQAKKFGETDDRLHAVAAWREAPDFTERERAALALAESVTRLEDRADPVPDEVWAEASKHFDERGMTSLLLTIATTNLFNRLNVSVRQTAGAWQ